MIHIKKTFYNTKLIEQSNIFFLYFKILLSWRQNKFIVEKNNRNNFTEYYRTLLKP